MGMMLSTPPTENHMYFQAYKDNIRDNEINIQFYSGMTAAGNCLRLIISLMMFESYGSIISTTMFMFFDVGVFIVIWYLVLMMFSMVALFVFSEVQSLESLPDAMLFFINASFGSYNLHVFDIYIEAEP